MRLADHRAAASALLFLSALLLMSSSVAATNPVMSAVNISPSTAFHGDTIAGYCLGTGGTANLTYTYTWFMNQSANATGQSPRTYCFQETANVSTACGGLSTGSYALDYTCQGGGATCVGDYSPSCSVTYPQNCPDRILGIIDGNYDAITSVFILSEVGNNAATFWANYTKPSMAVGAVWSLANMYVLGEQSNNTIDAQCIAQSTLQLRYLMNSSPLMSYGQCYNGTAWTGNYSWYYYPSGPHPHSAAMYEEAVFWDYGGAPNNTLVNVANVSTLLKGQNWTLSCQANDTNGQVSSPLNASITISNSPPANNWSRNNQSFGHNASRIFGDYCTDNDGDSLLYATNTSALFPLLANGSVNFTASLGATGNYSVNMTCGDGTANTSAIVMINVSNAAPNVTSVILTPLPAQAGNILNLSFSCNDPDNDACNLTRSYAWFRNGVQLNTTNNSLGPGNFTTGDNITGAVRASDTLLNSTWLNTTVATIGDTTPPVITNFTVTPLSTTTAGTITIAANCTDNNQVGTVYAEITDALSVKANFSMTNTSDTYSYVYPPPVAGTYSTRVFCTDGNGNVANTSTTVFTVSQAVAASSGGGGGGGGSVIVTGENCDFSIVRPTNGFVNTLCRTGETSGSFEFVLQNDENTAKTYTTVFSGIDCTIDQESFTVLGHSQHSSTISGCQCPTNTSIEGAVNITTETCTGSLPIKLYDGVFSRIIFDQDFLIRFMIGFFLVAIIAAGIILATR